MSFSSLGISAVSTSAHIYICRSMLSRTLWDMCILLKTLMYQLLSQCLKFVIFMLLLGFKFNYLCLVSAICYMHLRCNILLQMPKNFLNGLKIAKIVLNYLEFFSQTENLSENFQVIPF